MLKKNPVIIKALFLAAGAAGYVLSFPKAGYSVLAWFSLVPLISVVLRSKPLDSALWSFFYGIFAYAGIMYWIFPLIDFNTGSKLQALVCLLVMCSYLALYFGLWAFLTSYFRFSNAVSGALFASAGWVAVEYARTYALTGFPWALAGYSQWNNLPVIQISEYAGVYGVSFVLVLFNYAVFVKLIEKRRTPKVVPLLGIILAVYAAGFVLMKNNSRTQADSIRVSVLQGSIDQYKKFDNAYESEILDTYEELSVKAAAEKPDLIIWPETALPGYIPWRSDLFEWVKSLSRGTKAFNLVGAPYYEEGGDSANAAFLFTPDGKLSATHVKTHLVPFGEYVPFRKYLEPYFGILNTLGDFKRGAEFAPLEARNAVIGATICSENFFGSISRRLVLNGAELLTNQTNDAWYFKTSAAQQHFIMNVFRAVENRRAVAVSANTGVSGVVFPDGSTARTTGLFDRKYFTETLPLSKTITFYAKHGDIFAILCIIFTVLIGAASIVAPFYRRKK